MRNDGGKALSCQAYYEATEPVRMLVFVRQRECQITDYDSRSTWDRFLDAGSIPARSTFCKKCEKCINAGNACKIRLLRIFVICYDSGILVEIWLF